MAAAPAVTPLADPGDSPLHALVSYGFHSDHALTAMLKILGGGGAAESWGVDVRNSAGRTPLMLAVQCVYLCGIDGLLAAGARPTVTDGSGRNAFHFAALLTEYSDLVLEKLAAACNSPADAAAGMWARDGVGCSPLHCAAACGNEAGIRWITAHTAALDQAVNARTARGDTPLHLAVHAGSEACVRALLSLGANPSVEGAGSLSPLDVARRAHTRQISGILATAAFASDPALSPPSARTTGVGTSAGAASGATSASSNSNSGGGGGDVLSFVVSRWLGRQSPPPPPPSAQPLQQHGSSSTVFVTHADATDSVSGGVVTHYSGPSEGGVASENGGVSELLQHTPAAVRLPRSTFFTGGSSPPPSLHSAGGMGSGEQTALSTGSGRVPDSGGGGSAIVHSSYAGGGEHDSLAVTTTATPTGGGRGPGRGTSASLLASNGYVSYTSPLASPGAMSTSTNSLVSPGGARHSNNATTTHSLTSPEGTRTLIIAGTSPGHYSYATSGGAGGGGGGGGVGHTSTPLPPRGDSYRQHAYISAVTPTLALPLAGSVSLSPSSSASLLVMGSGGAAVGGSADVVGGTANPSLTGSGWGHQHHQQHQQHG